MSNSVDISVLQGVYEQDYHAYCVGDEPLVFHCHHYNIFLQNTIEDAGEYVDAEKILVQAAEFSLYHQWKNLEKKHGKLSEAVLLDTLREFGFGIIKAINLNENQAKFECPFEHYGVGYVSKYPIRKNLPPVSYFTRGFIGAFLCYYFDKPLFSYKVVQTQCFAKGDKLAVFEAELLETPEKAIYPFYAGQGVRSAPYHYSNPSGTSIDYLAIREALTGMRLTGSDETGLIDAFGVLLTRHYANYYCNISFALLEQLLRVLDEQTARTLVSDLLVEAGHVCAFNTFGGIMTSMEWEGLVKPMIKTREDWMHGIIACINALGWGTYVIDELKPYDYIRVRVYNGYESNHCLANKTNIHYHGPIEFLATGVIAGLMNLIYHKDITQKPVLDEKFYNEVFRTPGRFIGRQTQCRGQGAEYSVFEAVKEKV